MKFSVEGCIAAYTAQHGHKLVDLSRVHLALKHFQAHGLAAMDAEKLHPRDIEEYTGRRLKLDEAAPPTIRRELVVLRAALRQCHKRELISKLTHIPMPEGGAGRRRERVLSETEITKLLDACRQTQHVFLFTLLGLTTAQRYGAILDLTWDRIDWTNNTINFNNPKLKGWRKGRSIVPMAPELREELEAEKAQVLKAYGGEELIPPTVIQWDGAACINIHRAFRKAVVRAGLKPSEVTPHVLRHTAASRMAMADVPIPMIAEMLGHKDDKVTRSVYIKFSPSYLNRAVGVMSGIISKKTAA